MLSKEHLRFQRSKGSIVPRFVDATNKLLVNLTGEMIQVYQNGTEGDGLTREELNELTHPLINSHRSLIVAKGINKLLLDRCRFKDPDPGVAEAREAVFAAATRMLTGKGALPDLPAYREQVAKILKRDPDDISETLYADLPIRQPLTEFKQIEAEPLLHRYNMAQVQGLLLHAAELTAEIADPDVGKQRQFFRYLKFFQLMARIERPKGKGRFRITVDGPISVLTNTQKYGLQLAMFLPAIVAMEGWSIEAEIKQKGHRATTLSLDHNTVLKSHYNNLDAYRPDEFKAFAAEFRKTTKEWSLSEKTAPIDLGGQNILVPDFTFKHKASKKTVHLELFHRWHKAGLMQRLGGLKETGRTLLALGVDRAIKKDSRAQGAMNRSTWFQEHGFLYNGFPPVKRVLAALESFISS